MEGLNKMDDGRCCQVLVTGTIGASNDRVVLVGMNGSKNSWNALGWACAEVIRLAGRVVAVLVSPTTDFDTELSESVPVAHEGAIAQGDIDWVEGLRSQVQQYAIDTGVRLTFAHVRGDPVSELLRAADSHRAHLIVVGKSTNAMHNFVVSLGRRLVDNGDVPVIIDVA